MKRPSIAAIKKSLDKGFAVFSPSDENAQLVIDWIMPDIKIEDLQRALYYFARYRQAPDPGLIALFDPVPTLFAQYGIGGKLERVVRRMGREWWEYIKRRVADPKWIIDYMCEKNPQLKQYLFSSTGQAYMDFYSERLYSFFEVWFFKFPRYHNNCGGIVKYGLLDREKNVWGFFCRRCNAEIGDEHIDTLSYMHRNNPIAKQQ